MTKADVRAEAARLGLRTATKAESMDVCFITRGGRTEFLDARVPAVPGRIVDGDGAPVGAHDGVRAFTVGQRRGLAVAAGARRYVVDVDAATATVTLGTAADLLRTHVDVERTSFTGMPVAAGTRGGGAGARPRNGRTWRLVRETASSGACPSRGSRPARRRALRRRPVLGAGTAA